MPARIDRARGQPRRQRTFRRTPTLKSRRTERPLHRQRLGLGVSSRFRADRPEDALWNSRTEAPVSFRIAQKRNDLFELELRFIHSGYVLELTLVSVST